MAGGCLEGGVLDGGTGESTVAGNERGGMEYNKS